MDPDIKRDFPSLTEDNHKELSPVDFNYNCLAFVLGDTHNWWEPSGLGFYWPPGFREDTTVETVVSILKVHGYTIEVDVDVTPDSEAVAVYAEGNEWAHFARFAGGMWTSKLGRGKDVSHLRLEDLEGKKYGTVARILMRPRQGS